MKRKLSAVSDGIRHRMTAPALSLCNTLFFPPRPDVDEGDHAITCLGCIAFEDEDVGRDMSLCLTCDGRGEIYDGGITSFCPMCGGRGALDGRL